MFGPNNDTPFGVTSAGYDKTACKGATLLGLGARRLVNTSESPWPGALSVVSKSDRMQRSARYRNAAFGKLRLPLRILVLGTPKSGSLGE